MFVCECQQDKLLLSFSNNRREKKRNLNITTLYQLIIADHVLIMRTTSRLIIYTSNFTFKFVFRTSYRKRDVDLKINKE